MAIGVKLDVDNFKLCMQKTSKSSPLQPLSGSWLLEVQFGSHGATVVNSVFYENDCYFYVAEYGQEKTNSELSTFQIQIDGAQLLFSGEVRLDNRREIAMMLGFFRPMSDAELVCHAYVSKGDGFERLLVGDFSFAIFDYGNNIINVVRDQLGVCSLYFYCKNECCVLSNSLHWMVDNNPELSFFHDEDVIGEWILSGHVYDKNNTFFKLIKKCPPATILHIDINGVRSKSYWGFGDVESLNYANNISYIEHLQGLLKTVISDRLGQGGVVGAHSSGGLDSTPIAIIAGRLGQKIGRSVHTFNWCQSYSDVYLNNALRVAECEKFHHHEIGINFNSIKNNFFNHVISRDGTTAYEYESGVLNLAKNFGVEKIYSGFGGDEFLTSVFSDQHYNEIRAGNLNNVFNKMILECNSNEDFWWMKVCLNFVKKIVKSFLPYRLVHKNFFKIEKYRFIFRREFLYSDFKKIATSKWRGNEIFLVDSLRESQRNSLISGYHQERTECWAALGRRYGIRYVYPYLDKRIVEFSMAIPSDLYFRNGKPRYLYLQAIGDVIPDYLKSKIKIAEYHRVEQLIRESLKAISDDDVHEMIASKFSSYVDTKVLLEKCREPWVLNSENFFESIVRVAAISSAIYALNIR